MSAKRRQYSPEYKFKVALEAAKGNKTLAQISGETGVHPNQIRQWKGQLLDEGPDLFLRHRDQSQQEYERLIAELYERIGRLQMELEWLEKKATRFAGGQTRHG